MRIDALRFLYKKTLRRCDLDIDDLSFPKVPKKLPVVLSHEEVTRLIEAAPNLTYRTILRCFMAWACAGPRFRGSKWAIRRDEEYAKTCLQRHQNKLFFSSDCLHKGMGGRQCWSQQTLAELRRLAPSDAILTKILWQNARQLLRLG